MTHILYTQEQIEEAIKQLGISLNNEFKDCNKKILLVGVLNGSFMFLSDLCKYFTIPVEIEFVRISSYTNNIQGKLSFEYSNLDKYNLQEYTILIVEDIIDTGDTITFLRKLLTDSYNVSENNIKIVTLLDKAFKHNYSIQYKCFTLDEDYFVVGYGLDEDNINRNCPYIYYRD